jgi:predicted nucleic-acid-binding Zn-ribbon protein
MASTCSKCGSTALHANFPVVASIDNLSSVPVSIVTYDKPEARVFKAPHSHRLLARVCTACGLTELYVADPSALKASLNEAQSGS